MKAAISLVAAALIWLAGFALVAGFFGPAVGGYVVLTYVALFWVGWRLHMENRKWDKLIKRNDDILSALRKINGQG